MDTRTCTVSTGLRSHVKFKPLIPALEEIVQLRSTVETLACLVYTDALLHRLNEFPTLELPEIYLNQVCFNAAIRAVCRPNEEPSLQARCTAFPEEKVRKYLSNTMKYKIKDSPNLNANGLCELQRRKSAHETRNSSKVAAYSQASLDLQTAQQRFKLQVPDEFKCPSDNGLTETMNSASLSRDFSAAVFNF
jgi:hypothetical protein